MPSYSAGSVTAKVELDTSEFKKAVKELKGEVSGLKTAFNGLKGDNPLEKEVKQLKEEINSLKTTNEDYEKTVKNLKKELEGVSKTSKKTKDALKNEQKSLNDVIKTTNEATKANDRFNSSLNKTSASATSTTSYSQITSAAQKATAALTKMHEQNIKSAAKEANVIKKYTLEEISLMERLQSTFENSRDSYSRRTLYPIDNKYYSNNYSKYLRKYKRDWTTGGWGDYYKESGYNDFSKAFQKRMVELLNDMGVTVSNVITNDFKKVKGKSSGKLYEYLDISSLKDNSEWLTKTRNQLARLERWKEDNYHWIRGAREGDKYDLQRLKKEIDIWKTLDFEDYGKEGNPFFKDYLKESGLNELYKDAQRANQEFRYFDLAIKNASTAMQTFERMLNTTDVSLIHHKRNLTETGEALKKNIQLARESGTAYKGGLPSDGKAADILGEKNKIKETATAIKEYANSAERAAQKDKELETAIANLIMRTEIEAALHPKLNEGYRNWARNINEVSINAKKASDALSSMNNTVQSSTSSWDKLVNNAKNATNALKGIERNREGIRNWGRNIQEVGANAQKANAVLKSLTETTTLSHFEKLANSARAASLGLMNFQRGAEVASVAQLKFNQSLMSSSKGVEQYRQRIAKTADELKAKWHSMSVELAKANAAQYKYWQQVRGTANVKGWNAEPLKIKGYNDYLKAANAVSKYNKEIERNIALERKRRSAMAAKDNIAYSYENFNKASAGMALLNNQMDSYTKNISKSSSETNKFGDNVRKSGKGITTFNNGIVQTAHSGRILSNTLYQIRGALLSLKMILTAMGGMMLWGFAMEIAEGVKTTFTAKNEMETQLKQNAKVGENGLRDFNKELDNTIKKFQKVNKYQLGETVSSLGVEFDLTMKQMKKAMPIVAMVQSEYIRAGRTSEEAALAVKDILQGEFQRLSRETGVGKDELLQFGWSGDKEDIDSLLDAVKKAGESRHWDVFAAKATSLNDVMEITKNRFEEFGADFLQSISPAIVSGFNTLIGVIDGLQKAFNGLGNFGRNALVGGGFIGGVTAIGTLLPMVTKGMGLAEVATLGWGKSLATAVLNLNKTEVATNGFRKALAAVITGTSAAELSEVRWSKAIMGRVLGVNQGVLAQNGYTGALVHSRMALKGVTLDSNAAAVVTGNLRQKLIYLAKDTIVADKEAATFGKTLKALVTSTRLWGVALKGLIGIGIVAWFASIASWADTVKGRIDLFNDYIDNGKEKIQDAQKLVDDYNKSLQEMSTDDPKYYQTSLNKDTAEHNLKSIQAANELAKQIKKNTEDTAKDYDMMYQRGINRIYDANGYKATEEYNRDYQQMKYVAYDIAHAEEEREKFQYQSLQHINEHVDLMKQANVDEDKRLKYITEYSVKAKEAAENLKKFNEGDLTAGAYYVLNRLQLMWIDLWNDTHFVNFWDSVKKTWDDLQPTIKQLTESLGDLGHLLLDFFSTDAGQWTGGIAIVAGTIAIIGYKVAPVISKLKDFKDTLGGALDKVKEWRKVSGSDTSTDKPDSKTSTGGINGDIGGKGNGEFWGWDGEMGTILKNRAKSFTNNALLIAEAMVLMTEAILLINAPMGALAITGVAFKAMESQIRQGIEGLKLVAPVMAAFLPPVVALMIIMQYYGKAINTGVMKTAFKASAQVIAVGMLLVAEAIVMLVAPMVAIAALGYVKGLLGNSVEQGKAAIEATSDALGALVPVIPLFVVAIGAGLIALSGVGALVSVAVIAAGMLLVSAAIVSLAIPMAAIAALGGLFSDLSGIQAGAEAIKACATAMKYVSEAFGYMVTIQWDTLKSNVARLLGVDIGTALDDLVKDEDGFLPKVSKFAEKFNQMEFTPIKDDKAQALKTTAEGLNSVNDALKSATEAINNLPAEFKNGGTGQPLLSYDMETDKTSITGAATVEGTSSYFDQLKQPLEELGKFITWFNTELNFPEEGIGEDRVALISQSAEMITQVNDAVTKVKEAMGSIADAGWNQNMASGGITAALSGWFSGLAPGGAGVGDYSSSLGSSLQEMENVVKDIVTFNNKISTLVSGGNGDGNGAEGDSVNAMANMITAVEQAISSLNTTLANAVPEIKANTKAIGTGIRTGIKEGIGNLTEIVVPPLITAMNNMKANAYTYGKGVGDKGRTGFKETFKVNDTVKAELDAALQTMENKKQEFYDKGYALGDAAARGVKDGDDMHSPGIMSRTFMEEMGYISQTFDDAIAVMPQKAYNLSQTMASNFDPSFDIGGISVDELSAFQSGLNQVTYMANDTNTQTSAAFNNMNMTTATTMQGMTTTVNGAFTNINQNATTSYGRIVNTTRTSLKNMQDQTTKNITAIKTSWKGMQTALIASAEQIRSETSSKIHSLQNNMGEFWRKVQNPSLLLGAGGTTGTIRRVKVGKPVLPGTGTRFRMPMAGGYNGVPKRNVGRNDKPFDLNVNSDVIEYLKCLMNGGNCVAGGSGWHFNWSDDIRRALLKWQTHFGNSPVPYDSHLTVGKFENDNFPVRGIADIAKQYIFNAISQTKYEKYFDSKYGSPLAAWNAGHFNCVDGALVAIAFANAFGFPGGYVGYGSWNGIGHGFAVIPGLGVIDATAIQNRGSFTAPGTVTGYPSAGGTITRNSPTNTPKFGNTIEGDVVFEIHIDGDVENAEEKGKEIADAAGRKFIEMFRRSPSTGL